MSDVVLRCPNCGTTQAASGECEACHEGTVRYFCPNHSPGRWLDAPRCAECEARVARERAARPRTPARPPASDPPPRRSARREPPRPFGPRWAEHRDPPELDALAELEERARLPVESPPDWPFGRAASPRDAPRGEIRLPRIPFLGCVGQLIKLVVFLMILAALATCWFFSGSGIIIGERPAVLPAVLLSHGSGDTSPLPGVGAWPGALRPLSMTRTAPRA